jgi:2-polyprenyl-3-methyl-5-hydroxy-6-metoxy-1,4-benzoquinol methylase
MTFPARERWRRLPRDTAREEYFRVLQEAVTELYLADPANPYQQSGRSSGGERWEETRRCLMKAIGRDGDFMDIGCANGLLLETLIAWAREEGFSIRPYGIDFVPELLELARQRLP